MNLYHFKKQTYGSSFFVSSDSERNAIRALSKFLKLPENKGEQAKSWKKLEPRGYDIELIKPNEVVRVESA